MSEPTASSAFSQRYRGRFAPSPTGPLHFGSLTAALGSYLEARQRDGQWWLRIEDIDPPREVPGAADAILRALDSLGFEWDELDYQSRHHPRYADVLAELQSQHLIYPCTCSRRTLNEQRIGSIYPGLCRTRHFPCHERHAIRILSQDAGIDFEDRIQGPQHYNLEKDVGDFILRRADGYFSYQLAVAVDDADQGMTEVIRGSDLLDSTPRQIHVQQQLGLRSPVYGHLPVVLGPDGQKLSKQTGARAIEEEPPLAALSRAMRFLGHPPPEAIEHGTVQAFWDWAIAHWELARVPRDPAPLSDLPDKRTSH